jgi:hypothetical protein
MVKSLSILATLATDQNTTTSPVALPLAGAPFYDWEPLGRQDEPRSAIGSTDGYRALASRGTAAFHAPPSMQPPIPWDPALHQARHAPRPVTLGPRSIAAGSVFGGMNAYPAPATTAWAHATGHMRLAYFPTSTWMVPGNHFHGPNYPYSYYGYHPVMAQAQADGTMSYGPYTALRTHSALADTAIAASIDPQVD